MKKGPIILVLIGLAVLAGIMLMPRSPQAEGSNEALEHEHTEQAPISLADSLVDDALRKLETGELPPMQAVLTIRDVAERFPENLKANFTLGVMSMQTGQYSKAVDRFLTVIALDNQNADAHILLARSRAFLGDTSAAVNGLDSALSIIEDTQMLQAIKAEMVTLSN